MRLLLILVVVCCGILPVSARVTRADAVQDAYRQYKALRDAGRYREALAPALDAVRHSKRLRGAESRATATVINNLGLLYSRLGQYREAEAALREAMEIRRRTLPATDKDIGQSASNLGMVLNTLGRLREAEAMLREALDNKIANYGATAPATAYTLAHLATLSRQRGLIGEAERLTRQVVAIRRAADSAGLLAGSLVDLGNLLADQSRYDEAEAAIVEAIDLRRGSQGAAHPEVAYALNALGEVHRARGRHEQAQAQYRQAQAIIADALGDRHPKLGEVLHNLGQSLRQQGRYDEALAALIRALELKRAAYGEVHRLLITTLTALGALHQDRGAYDLAEPWLRQAVEVAEAVHGDHHPQLATALNDLAYLYRAQGRFDASEPLYRRALAMQERVFGENALPVAITLNSFGGLLRLMDRPADAEPPMLRSLRIREVVFADETPRLANALNDLGALSLDLRKDVQARDYVARALAVRERLLGPSHPEVGNTLLLAGRLELRQGQQAPAVSSFRRAFQIFSERVEPNHRRAAEALFGIARAELARGDPAAALTAARRGASIYRTRLVRGSRVLEAGWRAEQKSAREDTLLLLDLLLRSSKAARPDDATVSELLILMQQTEASRAARSVARMAARFATGDDALARLVRQRQEAVERSGRIDETLLQAAGASTASRDPELERTLRQELAALHDEVDRLDQRLAETFPRYAQLTNPRPLDLPALRRLLGPREALLAMVVGAEFTVVAAVTATAQAAYRVDIGAAALADAVGELRRGVDLAGVQSLGDLPRYDTRVASELYAALLAPAEALLSDVDHLLFVPDGAMTILPLGALVTEPQRLVPFDLEEYAEVPWLARRFAVSVLPSVSALRGLRVFAARTAAARPFIGYGDPVLEGDPARNRGTLRDLLRAGQFDMRDLRRLARLPETATEIRSLARLLGGDSDAVVLGEQATESDVRRRQLDNYRVVSFATHGLIPDEVGGLLEPALVLTPPETPSARDDGLLTATEVAELRLNADWVVLSACNTGVADSPGAVGLSRLADAFIYAGTRSLLVTHWSIESTSSVALTTNLFKSAGGGAGKAAALRAAIVEMWRSGEAAYLHPAFWAPFVLIGDGGIATAPPASAGAGALTVLKNANLRAAPSLSGERVGGLRAGEIVTPAGRDDGGDWLRVRRADGDLGYVHRSLVGVAH